ncbi:Cyanovirin-N [Massariosphaeria phaeospora]|uniref:Cyanovirin-N n=1 Tax=Massariosphaeria phaeospora TaxID=100035 RepID=A0A7C8M4Q8_9PLEO|nr:Cyanovirin-N [Massariosphaeria phaeospora]
MSFHTSAKDISIDGSTLKARLVNVYGKHQDAEIDLNGIIGNNNGTFKWGDYGFADSGDQISFSLEGNNVPILRARLFNDDGEGQDADINLAERLSNYNGELHFD